jgi:hypothetical protein
VAIHRISDKFSGKELLPRYRMLKLRLSWGKTRCSGINFTIPPEIISRSPGIWECPNETLIPSDPGEPLRRIRPRLTFLVSHLTRLRK